MPKKIFLHPDYMTLVFFKITSPELFAFLNSQGVKLEPIRWNGDEYDLPTDEPVIVRASRILRGHWDMIGFFCAHHGHLCFYNDMLIGPNGVKQPIRELLDAAENFLARS